MKMLDFYRQFIGPDDLVFDVGACVGARTEIFAALAKKVIAFDPMGAIKEMPVNVEMRTCAIGSAIGIGSVYHSGEPSVASMSPEWIAAVKKSKRFGEQDHWDQSSLVNIRPLDYFIARYGSPAFIKIDVEGYELEVLQGLSQPIKALSFEFTPECMGQAYDCIIRCFELGMQSFNFSLLEDFELGDWLTAAGIISCLEQYRDVITTYGDIYAKV